MRRALLVFAATSLVIGFTAAAAQEKDKWARGTVSAMAGDTITVDVKGQSMTFTVDKTTEVVKSGAGTKARETKAMTGKGPTLADVLKVGDHVEVRYAEMDGKMHATMVRAGISAPAMTSADAPKKAEGVVSEVSGSSLALKTKDGETMTFAVDAKTKVIGSGLGTKTREKKAEGAAMTLADAIASGDTVIVAYKEMGDTKQAKSVTVVKKGT